MIYSFLILSIIITTLIFGVIYFFLSRQSKKKYMFYWSLCWFLYCLMFTLDFAHILINGNYDIYIVLRFLIILCSGYLFLYGSCHFFQIHPPKFFNYIFLVGLCSHIICFTAPLFINALLIPNVIIASSFLIYSGCLFASYYWTETFPEKMLSCILILSLAFTINHFGFAIQSQTLVTIIYFIGAIILTCLMPILIIIFFKKTLHDSEKISTHFRTIVENSSDCMFLYSYKNQSFEYISPHINTFIGVNRESLYSSTNSFFTNIRESDLLNIFSIPIYKANNKVVSFEIEPNNIVWCEIHYLPIHDALNNIISIEGIIKDITDIKNAEDEIKEAELSKKALLENIQHEIKTPITLIRGYAESMIKNIIPRESFVMYLSMIVSKSKLLNTLLNDLNQVQYATSQDIEYKYYELNAEGFINELVEQAKFQIEDSSHSFEKILSIHKRAMIVVDKERISQVVTNLLNNAIRHTPEGGKIIISSSTDILKKDSHDVFEPLLVPDGELNFSISDTGDGLLQEDIPYLFNRSFQSKSNTKTSKNFGLGLFISKEIIKQHQGRIIASNNIDNGASFTFTIPFYFNDTQ